MEGLRVLGFRTLALCVLCGASSARADRLLTSGFEENNLTATMWTAVAGNGPSIVTTAPHSGTYHLRTAGFAGESSVYRDLAAAKTSGTLYLRVYFKTPTASPSADLSVMRTRRVATFDESSSALLLTTGAFRLRNPVTGTNADSTMTVSTGVYYRLELRHLIANTGGEMELRIYEGVSVLPLETLSITNEDTLNTDIGRVYFGKTGNSAAQFDLDDLAVNDSNGSFQNSWPGPGKIALVKPAGDDTVAWTKSGSSPAGTNAGGVSEVPGAPDDGVAYNSSTSSTQQDRLNLTALPAEIPTDADIILVDVYGRQGSNGTSGTRTITYEIWDESGTNTHGPTVSCSVNGWRIDATNEHQVFDAGSRTKANLENFDIGYRRTASGSNEVRVTALWANVEWTAAAAAAAVGRRAPIHW